MKNDEIKEANRRALPKLLLVLAIFMVVGFTFGFFASRYGLGALSGTIKNAGAFFGTYIAPWMILGIAVIMPVICTILYRRAKKQIDAWDGEDEDDYLRIDRALSLTIWISNTAMIFSYFLMAAAYSGGTDIFENAYTTTLFLITLVSLFAIIFAMLVIGQKCVDATKRVNPEKRASFYDMKFQKKWMEDCDEAERIMIGKCAFRAYSATNKVCALSAGILAACALVFDIGFLPSLAVCLVWVVNLTFFYKEAIKYAGAGNQIRR